MKRFLLPLILILFLTFTLIGDCADWLEGWDYRIELSISDYAGDIGASVTWFPVTVFLKGENWVHPDSTFDDGDDWNLDDNAIDGETGTAAFVEVVDEPMELRLDTPISCDKIRIYCVEYGIGEECDVKIEVWYLGGWHTIKDGTISELEYVIVEIGSTQTVSKAQVTVNAFTGVGMGLAEFEFNKTSGGVFTELTTDAEYLKVAFTKADGTTELYAEKEKFAHLGGIAYTSQYPPVQSDTYVKSTTKYNTFYWAYFATDPALSLTGDWSGVSWVSSDGTYTNQRFHIDLGSAKIIRRIYYENNHTSGGYTSRGVYNFILQGSNTGAGTFDDLVYANDEGWTELTVSQNTFDEHSAVNEADPKYITVTNTTAYRYYAFKFADNRSGDRYMGVRHIELQTEDPSAIYHISRDGWTINANTSIFLYYDKDHADNTDYIGIIGLAGRDGPRENVWNPNYKMVQHQKDETTSTITDSTSNNNDGTKGDVNEPNEVEGQVGKAQNFDGNDYINLGNPASLDITSVNSGGVTLEAVANISSYGAWAGIVSKRATGPYRGYSIIVVPDYQGFTHCLVTDMSNSQAYQEFSLASQYFVGSYDNSTIISYVNGVAGTPTSFSDVLTSSANDLKIGTLGYGSIFITGLVDEVRISNIARSAAWIKGTYNSLWDTLFNYGSEEEAPEVVTVNSIFFGTNF